MEHDKPQFDDPALQSAVKRALGNETAPRQLRERVERALAGERARPVRLLRPLAGVAAAAVLFIGFSVAYHMLWASREKPVAQWFAAAMVVSHDQCSALPDHHLIAPDAPNDLGAVRERLKSQLNHALLVTSLGDGWTFAGAGVCNIGSAPAAHMLFKRGDQTISIFSIPVANLAYSESVPDGTSYSQIEQSHPVSGFIQNGAVHCLVGSSGLSLREITRLREAVRGQVSWRPDFASAAHCALH